MSECNSVLLSASVIKAFTFYSIHSLESTGLYNVIQKIKKGYMFLCNSESFYIKNQSLNEGQQCNFPKL